MFDPGDYVQCVDMIGTGFKLRYGGIYKVVEVDTSSGMIIIEDSDIWWHISRFVLALKSVSNNPYVLDRVDV